MESEYLWWLQNIWFPMLELPLCPHPNTLRLTGHRSFSTAFIATAHNIIRSSHQFQLLAGESFFCTVLNIQKYSPPLIISTYFNFFFFLTLIGIFIFILFTNIYIYANYLSDNCWLHKFSSSFQYLGEQLCLLECASIRFAHLDPFILYFKKQHLGDNYASHRFICCQQSKQPLADL